MAQRAAFMAQKVNLPVRGVIENMSWFIADDGARYNLFGSGGGKELAEQLDVRLDLRRCPPPDVTFDWKVFAAAAEAPRLPVGGIRAT